MLPLLGMIKEGSHMKSNTLFKWLFIFVSLLFIFFTISAFSPMRSKVAYIIPLFILS